ncbi:nuclease [Planctomonas psychrotolerans]|uniref:nuclease n=1 Tax=Planctomonas psychrotolerans TaxID=2528712 RepID=UPI00123A8F0F|nr:nuclease [Planctomonas psychrotolerans]
MPNSSVGLLPIQRAVAGASPGAWCDGLVSAVRHGVVDVILLDGSLLRLTGSAVVSPGEPVAAHPVAEILAVGTSWYSARPIPL